MQGFIFGLFVHTYNHSFEFYAISFNSLSLEAITEGLVLFGEVMLPWSFLFLVFLFWDLNITILILLLEVFSIQEGLDCSGLR